MSSPIFYLFLWLENSQNTDILKLQALVVQWIGRKIADLAM